MRQFRDCNGRTWQLRATVRALDDIRDLMQIDLLGDPEQLPSLMQSIIDSVDLVASAGCLLAGADPSEFRGGLDAATIDQLRDSVVEELLTFFGHWRPATAATMREAWRIAAEQDRLADEGIAQLARSYTRWLESLGLTRQDSRSDN